MALKVFSSVRKAINEMALEELEYVQKAIDLRKFELGQEDALSDQPEVETSKTILPHNNVASLIGTTSKEDATRISLPPLSSEYVSKVGKLKQAAARDLAQFMIVELGGAASKDILFAATQRWIAGCSISHITPLNEKTYSGWLSKWHRGEVHKAPGLVKAPDTKSAYTLSKQMLTAALKKSGQGEKVANDLLRHLSEDQKIVNPKTLTIQE